MCIILYPIVEHTDRKAYNDYQMRPLEVENYSEISPSSQKEALNIRKNRFFTLTGTLLFKRFVPTGGDLINRHLHIRVFKGFNEESLKRNILFVNKVEASHWAGFIGLTGMSAFSLWIGEPKAASIISLINIPINIYPILLQRYNRQRLNHALNRFRGLRANKTKPFPPSPEEPLSLPQ